MLLKILFWISVFIVFYSYLGYGFVIWFYLKLTSFFSKQNKETINTDLYEPEVTLIVATYNEELIIKQKIINTSAINYPPHKLKIFFVADGSNDNTAEIIKQFPDIQLFYKPEREGKSSAINRVMPFVSTPYTIFSDANTFLNKECIREIVKHYTDKTIGAVAGEKKVVDFSHMGNTTGIGEGLYWKYESMLKKLDARFYTVVGAAGELFSIRTHLFKPVEKNILLDDFIISMKICMQGYRVMYEPNAFATESPSISLKDEQKRKIRIAAGGFQSIVILKDLLNIFKYGKLSFQYISHRLLRWLVCPILLPIIFLSNFYMHLHTDTILYTTLLVLQFLFYISALISWLLSLKRIKVKLLYIPHYFVFMNIAMYIGFFRFINNEQSVLWEKAERNL